MERTVDVDRRMLIALLVGIILAAAVVSLVSRGQDDADAGAASTTSAEEAQQATTVTAPAGGHSHGPTTLNGQTVKGVKAADVAAESQPDKPLDAATRAELRTQLRQARAVADQYPTVADATAAGYTLAGGFAPGSGAHYQGPYMTGGGTFRADRPMTLIYAGTSDTSELTGLMYYGMGAAAPEGFAGPNDHWHRHSNVCIKGGPNGIDVPFPADAEVTAAQCKAAGGRLLSITGWMVHAWVVPSWESPLGVFSHDNPNVRCGDGTYKTDKAGFCAGV